MTRRERARWFTASLFGSGEIGRQRAIGRFGSGMRLECLNGPLEHRSAPLLDSTYPCWIARTIGGVLIALFSRQAPSMQHIPRGATLLGEYVFDHSSEAMVWQPLTRIERGEPTAS